VLLDGTVSSKAQCFALCNRLGWERSLVKQIGFSNLVYEKLPVFAHVGLIQASGELRGLRVGTLLKEIERAGINTIIGCGRRTASLNAGLKTVVEKKLFNVQILNPRCGVFTEKWFDAVVTPRHDRMVGSNVFSTVGSLSWVTKNSIAEEQKQAARFVEYLGGPLGQKKRLTIILGGDTRRVKVETNVVVSEIEAALGKLVLEDFGSVCVVASRRTPLQLIAGIQTLGENISRSIHFRIWSPTREHSGRDPLASHVADNPYRVSISCSDAFIVTGDSVSIVSDVYSTGKPVFVIRQGVDGTQPDTKLCRFHNELEACLGVGKNCWSTKACLDDASEAAEYIENRRLQVE